jgi:hypothetical protein
MRVDSVNTGKNELSRHVVSLTNIENKGMLGQYNVMLSRGCNNTWGFCSAELKSREYYGESTVIGSPGSWRAETQDVLHQINADCYDCIGTWDQPSWDHYGDDEYLGWKANTYVNISNYSLRYGDT